MLRRVMKRLLNNGWHCIVGLTLILNGVVLTVSTRYFFWPPHPRFVTDFLNDDIVGYTGILIGVGMIHWAYQEHGSYKMNRFFTCQQLIFLHYAWINGINALNLCASVYSPHGMGCYQ